jgi:hypothetical protein
MRSIRMKGEEEPGATDQLRYNRSPEKGKERVARDK